MENWTQHLGYTVDFFTIFSFLGVVQGLFLSVIFLFTPSKRKSYHRYIGLFLLALSLVTLEIFLCYSGLIIHVIHLVDFSEPINFLFAPLFYLVVTEFSGKSQKKVHWHFLPFIFYFLYCFFFFTQSEVFKFNAFRWSYHPDLPELSNQQTYSADPWHIKKHINLLSNLQFLFYLPFIVFALKSFLQLQQQTFWQSLKSTHHGWLMGLFVIIFMSYGLWMYKVLFMFRDFGDSVGAAFNAFIIYYVNFFLLKNSFSTGKLSVKPPKPITKYQKSNLSDNLQKSILRKLELQMQQEKIYTNPNLSLKLLAEKAGQSPHHLSQVLNEKLGKSYYEWIAEYRVHEAKVLLKSANFQHYKLEEIGRMAGFNSRSAFYKAFKKIEGYTPTTYKNEVQSTK